MPNDKACVAAFGIPICTLLFLSFLYTTTSNSRSSETVRQQGGAPVGLCTSSQCQDHVDSSQQQRRRERGRFLGCCIRDVPIRQGQHERTDTHLDAGCSWYPSWARFLGIWLSHHQASRQQDHPDVAHPRIQHGTWSGYHRANGESTWSPCQHHPVSDWCNNWGCVDELRCQGY